MPSPDPHLADLHAIRSLLDRNTRFLSLSGLSGVAVGLVALLAAWVAAGMLDGAATPAPSYPSAAAEGAAARSLQLRLGLLAVGTLLAAVVVAWLFTWRLVRRQGGRQVLNAASWRMLWALTIPLGMGGAFCLLLLQAGLVAWIVPAMLLFYGLGLCSAAHFTHPELRQLGLLDCGLGLLAAGWPDYGLWWWAAGFGVLHILYGIAMYWRYERPKRTDA